jgi:hypothetical protein
MFEFLQLGNIYDIIIFILPNILKFWEASILSLHNYLLAFVILDYKVNDEG